MHFLWIFFQGLMVGFVMAAPLGPVAFFCIKRALQKEIEIAWIAGIGAALADIFLSFAAACGMGFFHDLLMTHAFKLRIGGSLLVTGIGFFLLFSKPRTQGEGLNVFTKSAVFSFSFFVTLFNPLTFMAFAAIFSALHLENLDTYHALFPLTGGVFAGALLWWSLLILFSSLGRNRFTIEKTVLIHKGTGGILCVLGIGMLVYSLF
jgi:arginine exporter protein ArgO